MPLLAAMCFHCYSGDDALIQLELFLCRPRTTYRAARVTCKHVRGAVSPSAKLPTGGFTESAFLNAGCLVACSDCCFGLHPRMSGTHVLTWARMLYT